MAEMDWNHAPDSFLSAADLNRIETQTAFLRGRLEGYGYSIALSCKTDWQEGAFPAAAELGRIRENINALQAGFYSLPDWREIARKYLSGGQEALDAEILNAEEWDLHALGVWVDRMAAAFVYSGEIFSGEV
ncbi:hypothetical protein [Intestinibacillus massiliensis]|uniref:hypothetical protein n=1 Tax=Intestinibacillus massiliensis TaxID=1871029 RepID=UPI000B35E6E1|nr:hypothetical protein [Intestinibacillus massiliensis]